MNIEIYFNLDADCFFEYQPKHKLIHVFTIDAPHEDFNDNLAWVYQALNVGHEPSMSSGQAMREQATAYRAKRLRSLSVGDVLVTPVGSFSVRFGFEPIDFTDAVVVEGENAS